MTGTDDFKATEADETTSDLNGQSKYDIDKIWKNQNKNKFIETDAAVNIMTNGVRQRIFL